MRGNRLRATSCEYKKKTRVVKTSKHAEDEKTSKTKKATRGSLAPGCAHSSLGVGCRGGCGELRGQERVGSRVSKKKTMRTV